jgi:hypothetical protein
MTEYQKFKDQLQKLTDYIHAMDTEMIEDEVHLKVDDNNVDEFTELLNSVCESAIVNDGFVNEVFEYLNQLTVKSTEIEMTIKLLPLFAALHSFYQASQSKKKKKEEIKIDDWVYEVTNFSVPLESRFGKVIEIIAPTEEAGTVIKIKTPITNEIVEWEDATFFIIPEMGGLIKQFEKSYTRKF